MLCAFKGGGMNRFQRLFNDKNKKAFVPFFMLGDPSIDASFELIKSAIDAGADALELGFPFSDPMADGPVIQASAERAILAHCDYDACIALVRKIRAYSEVPIGLLLYYNLLYRRNDAYQELANVGVDAVLVADMPIEESETHEAMLAKYDVGCIHLVAPNTSQDRAKDILNRVTAFAYVIGRYGTTGVSEHLADDLNERIESLNEMGDCPLVIGFGVSSAEDVHAIFKAGGRGAIIGSAITRIIEKNCDNIIEAKKAIATLVADCVKTGD